MDNNIYMVIIALNIDSGDLALQEDGRSLLVYLKRCGGGGGW